MLREFGQNIKPYLKDLYARAKALASRAERGERMTPQEKYDRALEADKRRIIATTERMRQRIATGDTSPLRPKREPRMDKEKARLLMERDKVRAEYQNMLFEAKLKQQTKLEKAWRYSGEALRTIRSVKTSFDVSALMNQGGFDAFGHPITAARSIKPMLEAMKSEAGQYRIIKEIQNDPLFTEAKQAGLFLAETDTPNLFRMEEVYSSRFAHKIPGVAMSERAYTTNLNWRRFHRYKAMRNTLARFSELKPNEAKIIANFVNESFGRGNLGKFTQAAELLNASFFAPRYRLSRIQLLLGHPLWHMPFKGSLRVRALILSEYVRSLAGLGLFLGAAAGVAGVTVELDPRSTDFGSIKIGDTRIDPLAGLRAPLNLMARAATGTTKTSEGDIEPIVGEVEYGKPTLGTFLMNYFRSGLTPAIGAAWSAVQRQNVVGQPTTPINEALSLPVPISANNIRDGLKAEGVPTKLAAALASISGMGVQTYHKQSAKEKGWERERIEERDRALMQGNFPRAFELSFAE
jgi:hypothetical protein